MKTLAVIMLVLTLPLVSHLSLLNAQEKDEKSKTMAEMLKATQPSERHKQLEPLAGSWNVLVRFKYGPGP